MNRSRTALRLDYWNYRQCTIWVCLLSAAELSRFNVTEYSYTAVYKLIVNKGENMRNYRIGFSIKGLIIMMLVMIPNIIWAFVPPANNPLANNSTAYPILDIIENGSQIVMFMMLILLVRKDGNGDKNAKIYLGLATPFLGCYYVLWIMYFAGCIYPLALVGMAAFPPIYYFFAALWIRNRIALIPCVIFGIFHIAITYSNYLL